MDIKEECLQLCNIFKLPKSHEKPLSQVEGGVEEPTVASGPRVGVWGKPLQGARRERGSGKRVTKVGFCGDSSRRADLGRYLKTWCLKTLKIKIKGLDNQNNINTNIHLQQNSTTASPTSDLTLTKPVYFANLTNLMFALLTWFFIVAVKIPCQYCKYGLQFTRYVLKFVVQCMLLFANTETKISQINSFIVAKKVFYLSYKYSLQFLECMLKFTVKCLLTLSI